jgi:hypothetical protein
VTDTELWQRVRGEYLAMPGLQLSVRQGCRLWSADAGVVREVFDELVGDGFLCHAGDHDEYYVRADWGAAVRRGMPWK